MTTRDDLIRYAATARTVTADGLAPYLDRLEAEARADERERVADEIHRADRPTFADGERPDLVVSVMRNIHVRIAEDGWSAPYWKPETFDLPEPSADTASMWQTASNAVAWLNSTNAASDHETAMRLMKLTEEAGEVMQAYIGLQGQNPRKGQTHTADDVAAELCDVILTAAVALHQFTTQPAAILEHHMRRVDKRMRQMGSATFPCGCRTGQGCTCPYPSASEEQQ